MYAESTQFQRWHFTTEEIDARRSKAYQNCLDAMERLSRDVSDPEDRAMLDLSQSLSREDSQKLQNLVERKTFRIAKEFQFPVSVPVNIPTIAHIDVLHARVDDLVDYISLAAKDSRTILDMELQVLEMNGFNLLVYHPYRPLKGFIQYIKEEIRPDAKHLKLLKSSAQEFVDESLFSDAMLCYSPAQIALACLIRACRNDSATMHLEKEIWNLDALLKESNSLETLKKVVEEILSIQEKQISSSETEQIQELNRLLEKWNKCHNLLNDPRSRIYHKQKIEKEEEEDQKKLEKQKASRLLRERKVHDLLNK